MTKSVGLHQQWIAGCSGYRTSFTLWVPPAKGCHIASAPLGPIVWRYCGLGSVDRYMQEILGCCACSPVCSLHLQVWVGAAKGPPARSWTECAGRVETAWLQYAAELMCALDWARKVPAALAAWVLLHAYPLDPTHSRWTDETWEAIQFHPQHLFPSFCLEGSKWGEEVLGELPLPQWGGGKCQQVGVLFDVPTIGGAREPWNWRRQWGFVPGYQMG